MKKLLYIFLTLLAIAASLSADAAKRKAKHVVMIGVDGLSAEVIRAMRGELPNIDALMDGGSYTLGKRSVMPSASAINWASMFNGLPTEMHCHSKWNSSAPEIPAAVEWKPGSPLTIFTLIRQQIPSAETGCIYNWDGIGPLIDTLSLSHYHYEPGYHAESNPYTVTGYTREQAVPYILGKKPLFFTFYIGDVDSAGHKYGWMSKEYRQSVSDVDDCVGIIVQALKDAGIYDDTIIIISSDHGGVGKGHGKFSLAELETPFIVFGKKVRQGEFTTPMMQYDTPATIAYILGVKIPDHWVGKPVKTIFK